ncbi:MAG: Ig-like domain-containing protein, partial [Sulfurimonadaceae bacterium]|nr:Ig-like domain-containing protein [Sulfurimonadaceae bacterium]
MVYGKDELFFTKESVELALDAHRDETALETALTDITDEETAEGQQEARSTDDGYSNFAQRDGTEVQARSTLDGTSEFEARVVEHTGSVDATDGDIVNSDTTAPDAPMVNVVDLTNSNIVKVEVQTEPNATITIKDDSGNTIGEGKADGDGRVDIDIELPEGSNDISVIATDEAGNESDPTDKTVIVDTTPPSVEITDITPNDTNNPADSSADEVIIKGNSDEANAPFIVKDKDGNTIGSGTTDSSGNFDITITTDKVQPNDQVTVEVTDKAGNIGSDTDTAGNLTHSNDTTAP